MGTGDAFRQLQGDGISAMIQFQEKISTKIKYGTLENSMWDKEFLCVWLSVRDTYFNVSLSRNTKFNKLTWKENCLIVFS